MKNNHPDAGQLALYAGGDLDLLERFPVRLHLRGCEQCQNAVASHRTLRKAMPRLEFDNAAGISNWDRLSDEMTANIRLGLSAAECIGPVKQTRKTSGSVGAFIPRPWVPALAGLGLCLLSGSAFWFNAPPEQRHTLSRALDAMTHGGVPQGERGVVLEATQTGLEMKQDGRSLITVRHPEQRKVASMSASLEGSVRAGYVDDETGQVTYTNVYSGQ